MELREYLQIIKGAKLFIIGGTLVIMLVSALVIAMSSPEYDTSVTITVDKTKLETTNSNFYQYDGFYTQQSNGFYADTVMNWLQSPSIVTDIYSQAKLDLPSVRNLTQLSKVFVVKKYPPATLGIKITSTNSSDSQKLLTASTIVLKKLTDQVNSTNSGDSFVLRSSNPVSSKILPFWALDMALAAVLGLVVTIFGAFFRYYLKKS